jgi:hypothetical protein
MKIYSLKIPDSVFKEYSGKNFEEKWYNGSDGSIIEKNSDGYYKNSKGVLKVLFKFRKKQISQELQDLAINTFLRESKKKHSNRGTAAGISSDGNARHYTQTGQNEGNYIASNISGYYDRPLREHKGILGTNIACRTTAFTNRNKELWEQGLPFIKMCSKLYKQYSPQEYSIQKKEWNSIKQELRIPQSVFTTITSNYNWRTACHCDSGDFSDGLGNLIVVGNNFIGGYLGFPQFKVLIKIEPGDILLMDVHQWHCNTPIKIIKDNGFRISFVMYIREDMKKCSSRKIINGVTYFKTKLKNQN